MMGLLNTYKKIKGDNHIKELTKRGRLAHLIKYARNQKGFSQQGLADKIGTAKSTITRIENGQNIPNITTIQQIAKELGCVFSIKGDDFILKFEDQPEERFSQNFIQENSDSKPTAKSYNLEYTFNNLTNNKSLFTSEVNLYSFISTTQKKEIDNYQNSVKENDKIALGAA